MSILPKQLIRYGLVLLGTTVAVGCSSDGDGGTGTGSITLSITPTSATVQQGASQAVTVTLTRIGGFTGTVDLDVTGEPTGVTATASNAQTVGAVTTATITIQVGATVAPALYPLVLHATGTGVSEVTQNFALTVTAAPVPALALSLSASALTITQGASTPTTTVTIARTNFTGNVDLSVLNLPTGVTASFNPANPQTGNSSVLTLTVAANAPTGTFTNLSVQGASTLPAVSTPLSLTIAAPAAPSIALSLSAPTLSIAQGASTPTTTVTIARTNFTGNVDLSVLNLPTGVTASFAPANPQTGNSSVLTLTVAANATLGTFTNLSVQGVGTPGTVSTPLSLTITAAAPTPSFTLALSAPALTIQQGASTPTTTVNITRVNFTGDVALSVLNLPTGVTAAFNPANPQTGNSSVLTLTVAASAPIGTFTNLSVQGVGTAGTVSTPLSLTITSAPGGGSGNVTVTFAACPAAQKAVWLAFRDGTTGAWTAVTGAADVYQFNITQSKGSFAYVTLGTGSSTINVLHFTQAELIAGAFPLCGTATPNTRVANGTVANLPAGHLGQISFGGGFASVLASGPFQMTNAATGSFDLIGFSHPLAGSGGDRAFIKRGENPAAGGSFASTVDFTDATLSAAAASAPATLQGLVGGETLVNHGMNFYTGGTACVLGVLYSQGTTAASFTVTGVPASLRLGTDMHGITVFASTQTSLRSLTENFLDVAARAATPFVLPAELPVPVVTDAGGPYKRPSATVTGVPAELNISHTMTYLDQGGAKSGVITATQGWVGGSTLALELPNFAGVGTFNNTWAPATGVQVNWTVSSSGGTFTTSCTAGQRFVTSTRTGTL